jgi:hypothetical protein
MAEEQKKNREGEAIEFKRWEEEIANAPTPEELLEELKRHMIEEQKKNREDEAMELKRGEEEMANAPTPEELVEELKRQMLEEQKKTEKTLKKNLKGGTVFIPMKIFYRPITGPFLI